MTNKKENHKDLASYKACISCIQSSWDSFLSLRSERLRHGGVSEKVAENILEDLFTQVLDWEKCDLKYQKGYSDIILSKHAHKYLVLEAKKPGSFGQRQDMDAAITQARRYADQQNIPCIAVSDGKYLYVADCCNGGLRDCLFIDLSDSEPPAEALWRISVYGINRPYDESIATVLSPEIVERSGQTSLNTVDVLLHPKYKLPVQCFAYAPHAHLPKTWKLPYKLSCGKPDNKRLPKAIQAILSNYRGTKVSNIPEQCMPDIILRLAMAAASIGLMPHQKQNTATIYQTLALAIKQHGIMLIE